MKNTLMFLMAALLALSLAACGGGTQNGTAGQTDGALSGGSSITDNGTGTAGSGAMNGSTGSVTGGTGSANGSTGTANNGTGSANGNTGAANSGVNNSRPDDTLGDDARNALDDAGRAVRNTVDGAMNEL